MHTLVELAGFFVFGVFTAAGTIFIKHDFFDRVYLVSGRHVVLTFTDRAHHRKY